MKIKLILASVMMLIGCAAPTRRVLPPPMPPAVQSKAKSANTQITVTNAIVLTFALQSTTDGTNWTVVTNWIYKVEPNKRMEFFRTESK